jgi:hypothetical protein
VVGESAGSPEEIRRQVLGAEQSHRRMTIERSDVVDVVDERPAV